MGGFTKENTKRLFNDTTPYKGTLRVGLRWGVDDFFVRFLASKGAWCNLLDLKFNAERIGFFNHKVTITCEGPKDAVVLWTTTFSELFTMEMEREYDVS